MEAVLKHPLSARYKTLFNSFNVNTPLRLSHFFAQADHESNLKPQGESLNYSVDGLINGFGRHRISIEDARKYGRTNQRPANQIMIANLLYGGEWGRRNLGNTQPNDGWNFRGKGIFQITGRNNYTVLSKDTRIDYLSSPDLLLTETDSLIAALWFWNSRHLNKYADVDDGLSISKIINLGSVGVNASPKGLTDRLNKVRKYKALFECK